jgi:hypothetical protein
MVLMMARREAGPHKRRKNSTATFFKDISRKPENLTVNRQIDSLNKSHGVDEEGSCC